MKQIIAIVIAAILVLIGIACAKNIGLGLITFLMLAGLVLGVAFDEKTA